MANPGPSWHIVGTGDFNADGHADILWQNDNGTPAIWLMNGLNFIGGGGIPNPGDGRSGDGRSGDGRGHAVSRPSPLRDHPGVGAACREQTGAPRRARRAAGAPAS